MGYVIDMQYTAQPLLGSAMEVVVVQRVRWNLTVQARIRHAGLPRRQYSGIVVVDSEGGVKMEKRILKFLLAYSVDQVDATIGMLNYIDVEGLVTEEFVELAKKMSSAMHEDRAPEIRTELFNDKTTTHLYLPESWVPDKAVGPEITDEMKRRRMEEEAAVETICQVVGMCPRCGHTVRGKPTRACKEKKQGRHFYKECVNCTYYSEIFKQRNKYIEREGG